MKDITSQYINTNGLKIIEHNNNIHFFDRETIKCLSVISIKHLANHIIKEQDTNELYKKVKKDTNCNTRELIEQFKKVYIQNIVNSIQMGFFYD